MGGPDPVDARGLSIVTDASGNVYVAGFFKGRVDFDPGPGIYNLDPLGPEDFYISKFNRSGEFLWVRQMDVIDNTKSAWVEAIALDSAGNVLITGNFSLDLIGFRIAHCFASKLDADGNLIWTRTLGEFTGGASIAADALGNVYIVGQFSGESDFDPGPGVFNLSALNSGSLFFVSKLDANGNFIWAKQLGGGNNSVLNGEIMITTEGIGYVYISGTFWDTQDFDPGPAVHKLTGKGAVGAHDIFVLKLDADGNFVWVKQMGGDVEDVAVSAATDGSGNIYTAGSFRGTADFDPGPGTYFLSTSGDDIAQTFISKLDRNGNLIWAAQLVGNTQWCYSIALDNNGNLYTIGYFGNTLDVDPGPGTYNLSTSGYDIFISKLNSNGNFVWAKKLGGTATIIGNSIAVDADGNVYSTGYFFSGQVDFDPGPANYFLSSGEGENIYLHKMSQCLSNTSSAITASVCKNYTLNGQTYSTSGVYTQILTSSAGCDSILTLNLTFSQINEAITIATCTNYTWNNHIYSTSGTYKDTLITANGCDSIVILNLTITSPLVTNIAQSICAGQSINGHTATGDYTDTLMAANGCDSIITLKLTVLPQPSPDLGADKSLCPGDTVLLYPGRFTIYTWQDGSSQDHFTIKQPGLYSVAVTDNCGSARDEIIIKAEEFCDIYFPNAFTPNNDGLNDLFKIVKPANLTEYHLSVYNRWGQKVFETFDYSKGWNGQFNGQLQSSQTFIWHCELKKQGNATAIKKRGMVSLIR